MRAHAETLWACDFMVRRIVTPARLRDAFVLVFIHVASRRALAVPSTIHPDAHWVSRQATRIAEVARAGGGKCGILVRDSDSKFGHAFDSALRVSNVTPLRLPHLAPNLNAHAERLIQTMQVECLDRFLVFGNAHLDHLVAQFLEHYNYERPHSGIGYRTPCSLPYAVTSAPTGRVACARRLGGTLHHYYRKAG